MDWFWDKVDASGDCWEWTGPLHNPGRYGRAYGPGFDGYAHRYAWTTLVGPIPDGFQIDHLCRNPPCVNPDHLEPVTPAVNALRAYGLPALNATKTHCLKGHPFDKANTYIRPNGDRNCRRCQYYRNLRIWERQQRQRLEDAS